jgi:hypothetical protein
MLSSIRPERAIALWGGRVKGHSYSPLYKGKRPLCLKFNLKLIWIATLIRLASGTATFAEIPLGKIETTYLTMPIDVAILVENGLNGLKSAGYATSKFKSLSIYMLNDVALITFIDSTIEDALHLSNIERRKLRQIVVTIERSSGRVLKVDGPHLE